ncbi:DEAD/DEAH box helicase, partial [Mycoplasma marinum]
PSFISKKQVKYKSIEKEILDRIVAYAFHAQGIKKLKDEQFLAVKKLLIDGGNILAVLKTGFGKSLIYQLFSFLQPVIILAIFPINALIDDQNLHLNANGFDFSMSNAEIKKKRNRIDEATLANKRLFLITAERLENIEVNYMLKSLAHFVGAIVFDEAHCISEWGHDFRPSYLVVRHVMQNIKERNDKMKIIALTATAAPYIQKDIMNILNINSKGLINLADGSGLERKELKYKLIKENDSHLKTKNDKKRFWGEIAVNVAKKQEFENGVSILYFIYANKWNRKYPNLASAEHAFEESSIKNSGLFIGRKKEIINELGEKKEEEKLNPFKKASVLFATKSFGMGVNIEECNYVGLIQPPSSLEDLYQQAGRAGRKGQDSLVEIRYSNSHLVDPMQKSSPFRFFLSNDKVRVGLQPYLVDELLSLIEENNFKDLIINVKELHAKQMNIHEEIYIRKNNFDNYLKWSIAHLINEFGIIDYYVVNYGMGTSLKTIRIFVNKANKKSEDIDKRIEKTLSNYAIDNNGFNRIDKIKQFYEFYFAEIEKQKKTGINIFVNELRKIDKIENFD